MEECLIGTAPLESRVQDESMECAARHKKEPGASHCVKGHGVCNGSQTQGVDGAGKGCSAAKANAIKPKVAFLCVHNSCRSQMAEALGRHLAGDVFESYSAGTEPGARINPDAVCLMKQVYGIDMEREQYNKPLSHLPAVDIVVTMGCNVQCPVMPCSHREDWGLDDPSGREDGAFLAVMERIEEKVLDLKRRIQTAGLE